MGIAKFIDSGQLPRQVAIPKNVVLQGNDTLLMVRFVTVPYLSLGYPTSWIGSNVRPGG